MLSGAFLLALCASAALAAALAALRPARPETRAAAAWLLAAEGVLLVAWGAAALAGGRGPLALHLPPPLPPLVLALRGLGPWWAVLAGVLFTATGLGRSPRARSGGVGTVLLLHLLLLGTAWFIAAHSPLALLLGWEAVSAAAYFLLVRDRQRVRRAAWALLSLSEFGAALLYFTLLVLQAHLAPLSQAPGGPVPLPAGWRLAGGLLALFAFGAKAGLFPLQVWVPFAEPEAPGDVAGLFSGLLTAVAIAGFLRVVHALDAPGLVLGIVTAAFGLLGSGGSALLGLIERDAKRALAYGTLEALGLTFTGLGLALVLQSRGAGDAAVLAAAGALTLLAAHAGAKFTLFSLAGHLEDRAGLRRFDRMGGLLARLRRAGGPALLGVCTLAALPPLGGFLGEWLLLESCLVPTPRYPDLHVALGVVGALIALVAALGLTLYLRWFGAAFLGPARTPAASGAPDVGRAAAASAWLALSLPAVAGIGAGWTLPYLAAATPWLARGAPVVAPTYLHPAAYAGIVALGAALFRGVAGHSGNVLFPADGFSVGSPWDLACFAAALGGVVAWAVRRVRRPHPPRRVPTWVGGEAYSPAEGVALGWTAEGFSHALRLTFATFFALRRTRVPSADPDRPGFRYRAAVVLRLEHHVYRPLLRLAARLSGAVRQTQSGDLAHYVGYMLAVALLGLAWIAFSHP